MRTLDAADLTDLHEMAQVMLWLGKIFGKWIIFENWSFWYISHLENQFWQSDLLSSPGQSGEMVPAPLLA